MKFTLKVGATVGRLQDSKRTTATCTGSVQEGDCFLVWLLSCNFSQKQRSYAIVLKLSLSSFLFSIKKHHLQYSLSVVFKVEDLFLLFAKKASAFNSWFENAEEDLTDPVRCNSVEEIRVSILPRGNRPLSRHHSSLVWKLCWDSMWSLSEPCRFAYRA